MFLPRFTLSGALGYIPICLRIVRPWREVLVIEDSFEDSFVIVHLVDTGPAQAGSFALTHDRGQAADYAGGPAVVPVGGVLGCWSFGEVGEGPELIEPGQLPSGFGPGSPSSAPPPAPSPPAGSAAGSGAGTALPPRGDPPVQRPPGQPDRPPGRVGMLAGGDHPHHGRALP
jgi:hypothetical protein